MFDNLLIGKQIILHYEDSGRLFPDQEVAQDRSGQPANSPQNIRFLNTVLQGLAVYVSWKIEQALYFRVRAYQLLPPEFVQNVPL